MARILIVEDEVAIATAVADEMEAEGYEIRVAADGRRGLELVTSFDPDILLLDLMLPGLSGFEVCRRAREIKPMLWIVMVTARDGEIDRVAGLEGGADDYVTKPFSLRELVARVRSALRRMRGPEAGPSGWVFADIRVDGSARRVYRGDEALPLTRTEYDLLEYLVRRSGVVVPRDEFLDAVWGENVYVTARAVDTHLSSLRKKLGDAAAKFINNVRGIGYRLDATVSES